MNISNVYFSGSVDLFSALLMDLFQEVTNRNRPPLQNREIGVWDMDMKDVIGKSFCGNISTTTGEDTNTNFNKELRVNTV